MSSPADAAPAASPSSLPAASRASRVSRTQVFSFPVQFGDCDPAGIVFFPNYSRWMDAASAHFFACCGVPSWRELERTHQIIGTPVLEQHNRFHLPAQPGDTLQVHATVKEWRAKVFIEQHRVMRGEQLLCEGVITRAFCTRLPDGRLKALPVPEDLWRLCTEAVGAGQ